MTFAEELRSCRNARNLSLRRCAGLMYVSPGYLSKLENGKSAPTLTVAKAADALFETKDRFQSLIVALAEVSLPNDDPELALIPHETADGRIVFLSTSRRDFLQGLGAVLATTLTGIGGTADIKPIAYFRAAHATLINNDNMFGPRDVIPQVQKQIMAIGRACESIQGADAAELIQLRTKFAELCGWLYQDLGDHISAQYWVDRALDWSYGSFDPHLTTYILARKSQLAGDMGDSRTSIGIGEAAARSAAHSRLTAVASTYAAHGYALAGDQLNAERSYDLARELASRAGADCEWGVWLDQAYIDVHLARSFTELGEHSRAVEIFTHAIKVLPDGFHRDKGVYLARAARAHAGAGDADAAAAIGLQSLVIAAETSSGRTASELVQLSRDLAPIDTAAVRQLQHAIRETVNPEGVK